MHNLIHINPLSYWKIPMMPIYARIFFCGHCLFREATSRNRHCPSNIFRSTRSFSFLPVLAVAYSVKWLVWTNCALTSIWEVLGSNPHHWLRIFSLLCAQKFHIKHRSSFNNEISTEVQLFEISNLYAMCFWENTPFLSFLFLFRCSDIQCLLHDDKLAVHFLIGRFPGTESGLCMLFIPSLPTVAQGPLAQLAIPALMKATWPPTYYLK